MENKAITTVKKYNMITPGDSIVVGLSGGADSCALLHFLAGLRKEYRLHLTACHINHMIRGEEAYRDEEFARRFAEKNGAEFRLLRADIPSLANERRESTEKCARDVRYEFFSKIAAESGAKIATAHTASDNAETVIFNLTRGSGINGLCGIPPVRGNIIRPLIEVSREEIEKYCRDHKLEYVTDSTNLHDDYSRNKIRHQVIPVLKDINPSFEGCITRMTENMRCNAKYLDSEAKSLLQSALVKSGFDNTYKADLLYSADNAVFSRAIAVLCSRYDIIPESGHIRLIKDICASGGAVQLRENIFAVSKQGMLRIINKEAFAEKELMIPFEGQKSIVINNKKYSLEIMPVSEMNNAEKNVKILFANSADYDTIGDRTVFRYRQPGDRFRLPGRNMSKSLKKLFNEMKIPSERRDSIIVLARGNDIIWIEGIGFSDGHLAGSDTKTAFDIIISGGDPGKEKTDE